MATENITNSLVSVEFLPDQTPVISSREMALHFQKKHKHILDEIKRIQSITPKSFSEPNFRPAEYTDEQGKPCPCYYLTRDAFSLLAMGFTGKAAIQWKLRYIEAFNALERAVQENIRGKALLDGFRLHERMTAERTLLARKAQHYRSKGLTYREVGKLLDCHHSTVMSLIADLRTLASGGTA